MRRRTVPPWLRASAHAARKARTWPRCRSPVGEGARRVVMDYIKIGWIRKAMQYIYLFYHICNLMSFIEPPPTIDIQKGLQFLWMNASAIDAADQAYPYWSKAKYLATNQSFEPKDFWEGIKAKRHVTGHKLPFAGSFIFNVPNLLDSQLYFLHAKSQGVIMDTIGSTTLVQKRKYILSGLINEAFSSSTIEGAVSTRDRAKELVAKRIKPINKSDRMILNNYEAMEYIRQNKSKGLTFESILELHEILGHQSLDQGTAGSFRTAKESITIVDELSGEDVYFPPPAIEVKQRMKVLIEFFNEDAFDPDIIYVHPMLRASIIHFMIGHIHPFSDGNGRIARALFYWHLLKNGYWLAEYLSISQVILESKTSYYKAFAQVEADGNDMTYFLLYKTKVLVKAFEYLKAYLQEKLQEQETGLPNAAVALGITIRQASLLESVRSKPKIWKVVDAERIFNVSHATARADLNALTEKGLLERFNLDKKTQAWRLV